MARKVLGDPNGAALHSSHGSVYTCEQYRRLYEQIGVHQSMGTNGTSADNSLAKSFNASLKLENLQNEPVFPVSWYASGTCFGGGQQQAKKLTAPSPFTNTRRAVWKR